MLSKILSLAFCLALSAAPGFADVILAQNGPHAAFNLIPFGNISGAGRYQQIYSSSLFSSAVDITSLAFSPEETGAYSADVTLRLTTTNLAVGALSPDLNSNFTTPLTTVFSDPAFSENVTGGAETFSLIFNLTTPFLYDPASGNLLLDVLITPLNGMAVSRANGGAVSSRAFDTAGYGNGTGAVALRTEIGFTAAVPEPGTIGLIALVLLCVGSTLRRKLSIS